MAALQTIWSQSGTGKKTGIAVGVGAILIFLIGASVWLLRADYQVLFSGMDPRDAAAVVNELEHMKVDYRLEEGGTRIVVSSDVVHQVRLKLMGSEMPIAGTVGLEIFNDSDFGMTEFSQKINYQRALQGELTRTIMSLDEVKYARVHLVMPESGLFKLQDKEPSASVTLFLKQEQTPVARQISGIQRLVASSVPELKAEMVTVSDQRGQTLSKPREDATGMESISNRLQKQKEVETYYTEKIMRLLVSRYHSDDIAVSVNVNLSFDQVRVTRQGVLDAENSISSGVLKRRESSFGADGSKDKSKSKGTKTTEVEYELGHQIEQTVEAPGRILRINVGVLVPSDLGDQHRQEINDLVSMVIGLDASRGDAVAVYSNRPAESALRKAEPIAAVAPEPATEEVVNLPAGQEVAHVSSEVLPLYSGGLEEILRKVKAEPVMSALICVLFVFSLMLLWLVFGVGKGGRGTQAPMLSEEDRQKVLTQVQEWLAGDEIKDQPSEVRA